MIWLLINAPWHEWKVTSTFFIDVITDLWPSPDVDLSNPCYQNKPRDLYFDSRCLCLTLLPTAMPLLCPTFHILNENRFWLLLLKNIDIIIRTSFNQICSAIIKFCLDGMRALSLNTYFMTDEDLVAYSKMGVSTMQWDSCPISKHTRPWNPYGANTIVHDFKIFHHDVIIWNIFRVTGPLWEESTGHRWFPLTKASDATPWCFLWSAPEQTLEQTNETPVIWDAIAPI